HERQVAPGNPVLDRVRQLLLVAVLDLHREVRVPDELGDKAVIGKRLDEARTICLACQLNGAHRTSWWENWASSVEPFSASVELAPPDTASMTWSKCPAPTSRWWRAAV